MAQRLTVTASPLTSAGVLMTRAGRRRAARGGYREYTARADSDLKLPRAQRRLTFRPRVIHNVAPSIAMLVGIHAVAHTHDGSRNSQNQFPN